MSSSASVGMIVGLNLVKSKHAMKNICKDTSRLVRDEINDYEAMFILNALRDIGANNCYP